MDCIGSVLETMEEKYRLELNCMELQTKIETLAEKLPQALLAKRTADEQLREYENGGILAFFHKLAGDYPSKLEKYRMASRTAANMFEQMEQEHARMETELARCCHDLQLYTDFDRQIESILQSELPEQQRAKKQCAQHMALLHGKTAMILLKENRAALQMARSSMKNELPTSRLHMAYNRDLALQQADRCADAYRRHLEACNRCLTILEEKPIHIGDYFLSPTGFIVDAVSEWAWLDRINLALKQIAEGEEAFLRMTALLEA